MDVKSGVRQLGTTTETVWEDAPSAESTGAATQPGRKRRGLAKLLHDLRHRRRRFRQLSGGVFVVLVTLLGDPRPGWFAAGAALVVLGMAVRLWASGFVMKNEVLATTGPYARVRHPLYVGNLIICAGFCLASGLWWSAPVALVVILLTYPEAVRYEDQKLQRLFPGEWDRWADRTRALVPRLGRGPREDADDEGTSWSLRLSMARNGEPIHVAVLSACLIYLYWILSRS